MCNQQVSTMLPFSFSKYSWKQLCRSFSSELEVGTWCNSNVSYSNWNGRPHAEGSENSITIRRDDPLTPTSQTESILLVYYQ